MTNWVVLGGSKNLVAAALTMPYSKGKQCLPSSHLDSLLRDSMILLQMVNGGLVPSEIVPMFT